MALERTGSTSAQGITEFEILKASHRFLREDEAEAQNWNDQLAVKYEQSLYREFAVANLKHYKSGNFALRWRTESEVLSGAGETTCGNTRCKHFDSTTSSVPLTTLELPFVYLEHGETKTALVKVILCPKCVEKLMWKRKQAKDSETAQDATVRRRDSRSRSPRPSTSRRKSRRSHSPTRPHRKA